MKQDGLNIIKEMKLINKIIKKLEILIICIVEQDI
jgi:hypothetical protein